VVACSTGGTPVTAMNRITPTYKHIVRTNRRRMSEKTVEIANVIMIHNCELLELLYCTQYHKSNHISL